MDYTDCVPIEHAADLLLRLAPPPGDGELLPLLEAHGRIAAADVSATVDQPPFDRSPLDGYAVDHRDLETAGEDAPVTLLVTQTIFAGDAVRGPVTRGEAARIMTGAPLPPGATCVVRQEDTDLGEERVAVFASLGMHDNYCFRGEDVQRGAVLVRRGERLTSAHIGILAGQGLEQVRVAPRPSVGVLATGYELVPTGASATQGKIHDSNSFLLAARAAELGMAPLRHPAAGDDAREIATAIQSLLGQCDMVVTTGGVSVGVRDLLPDAIALLQGEVLFHGLDCKPGAPAMAARVDGKIVLSLSGNPFAAFAIFELLAAPALRHMAGAAEPLAKRMRGVMRQPFAKPSPGRRFVRARIDGEEISFPGDEHASGALSSLAGCNCLIDIPPGGSPLGRGQLVEVVLL